MTPFQQFRLWVRRAPNTQRVPAGIAVLVVVGLLIWVIVPSGGSGGSTTSNPTGATVAAYPSTPPSPAPKPSSCTNPSGTLTGVTSSQIKLGVIVVNITGLASNAQFGILPVTQQKAGFQAIINAINTSGGVDCRQIVPDFITANPADTSDLQQVCLKVVSDGDFAAVDSGAFAAFPIVDCFGEHRVPYFGGYLLPASEMNKFYPYLFELNSVDTVYHDTIAGLVRLGFFKPANGYQKLGVLYQDCHPEIHAETTKWLAEAGVPASTIVNFDVGCPSAFTSSVVLEQAILKFKKAGVTNMTEFGGVGDFPTFTKLAQAQNFRPKYGLPDDSLITTSYGTQAPDAQNIANAYAITASRDGEERTPGMTQTPASVTCSNLLGTSVYKLPAAAGNACDQMWMFAAAVDHAPTLSRESLAGGLKAAGSVIFSYPQGPNDFAIGNKVTYGGQYWRTTQFHESCQCWQVIDQTFRPSAQ
ncbi:MAG TPA: ABC transporter substrate-binding protein [Mycobacteriales bacterium]|nr:ABC transporter substrate-binding protein [Mycobacteriales bacterium]